MLFENNYIWPGTTAVIYSLLLDYDFLGFYTTPNPSNSSKTYILLPSNSQLEEIGIEWKKSTDSQWTVFTILDSSYIEQIKGGLSAENTTNLAKQYIDTTKYVLSSPTGIHEFNFIMPMYIVLINLDQVTSYTVRGYYIKNGVKYTYNECTTTTFQRNDIYYECTEVTGGTEYENNYLKNKINEGCVVYNAMTNFKISTAPGDNLGSKTGGGFKGTYDPSLAAKGAAAHSGMVFASYSPNVSTVVHEMAHNLMKNLIDERENEEAYNKIIKFMEFATHSNKATWRWQSGHNYPVISSASYYDAYLYFVAAACRVCRDASNLL